MKKIIKWILILSFIVFIIAWGVMGLKLVDHDYNIKIEAYIGLICWSLIILCTIYRVLNSRCPYCGRLRVSSGEYCSFCGKELNL